MYCQSDNPKKNINRFAIVTSKNKVFLPAFFKLSVLCKAIFFAAFWRSCKNYFSCMFSFSFYLLWEKLKNHQKYLGEFSLRKFSRLSLFLLLSFLLISCGSSEQCVEADDFGEQQTDIVIVPASNSKQCNWDSSKNPDEGGNPDAAEELKRCVTAGDGVSAADEELAIDGIKPGYSDASGEEQYIIQGGVADPTMTNEAQNIMGCYRFSTPQELTRKEQCIARCINICEESFYSSTGTNMIYEPGWVTTMKRNDENEIGVNLTADTKIYIEVKGQVTLTSSLGDNFYVKAKENNPNLYQEDKATSEEKQFNSNETATPVFKGGWTSGTTKAETAKLPAPLSIITGQDNFSNAIARNENFARRAVIYQKDNKPDDYYEDININYGDIDLVINNPIRQAETNSASNSKIFTYKSNEPFILNSINITTNAQGGCLIEARKKINKAYPVADENTFNPVISNGKNDVGDNILLIPAIIEKNEEIKITVTNDNSCNIGSFSDTSFSLVGKKIFENEVNMSGFIELKSGGNCNLDLQLINYWNNNEAVYEYGKNKKISINLSTDWTAEGSFNGSNGPLFIRKGQFIRFLPSLISSSQCSNLQMKIKPRPAVLCREKPQNNYIDNPKCSKIITADNGSEYCEPDFSLCLQEVVVGATDNIYCPYVNNDKTCVQTQSNGECQSDVDTFTQKPSKSNPAWDYVINSQILNILSSADRANCTRCLQAINNIKDSPKINFNSPSYPVLKCWDLENYQGRVSYIFGTESGPGGSNATDYEPNNNIKYDLNFLTSIGLKELSPYSLRGTDDYGNLGEYSIVNEGQISPKIPLRFDAGKFLTLFTINNSSFEPGEMKTSIDNVTSLGSNEGFFMSSKVNNIEGFSNGKWLEVILCDSTLGCFNPAEGADVNVSPVAGYQEYIVKIDDNGQSIPVQSSFNQANSRLQKYEFNEFGQAIDSLDVTGEKKYYIHKIIKDVNTEREIKGEDLRLAFKIKDPDTIQNSPIASEKCTGGLDEYNATGTGSNTDLIKQDNPNYWKKICPNKANASDCRASTKEEKEEVTCTAIMVTNPNNEDCFGAKAGDVLSLPKKCQANDDPCQKKYLCVDPYANNKGEYEVKVTVIGKKANTVSNLVGSVMKPILNIIDGEIITIIQKDNNDFKLLFKTEDDSVSEPQELKEIDVGARGEYGLYFKNGGDRIYDLDGRRYLNSNKDGLILKKIGLAERMYKSIINDPRYRVLLNLSLVLMITFYGVGYVMGISQFSQNELMMRVIKIGLIYLMVGAMGWFWFERLIVDTFKSGVDFLVFSMATAFEPIDAGGSPEIMSALQNNDYTDKSVLFHGTDNIFGLMFSSSVQKKVAALIFSSFFGWIYAVIIYLGFLTYLFTVASAVLIYLTAQIFMSLLFVMGPIFFILTLFPQTKGMLDKWFGQLLGFAMQQIMVITTLAFFNLLMEQTVKMAMSFRACWGPVWIIKIPGIGTEITLFSFWTVAGATGRYTPGNSFSGGNGSSAMPHLFVVLFIYLIASIAEEMVKMMSNLGASMAGGLRASDLSSGIAQAAKQASQFAKGRAQKAWKNTGGQLVRRVDKALFNSGAKAEQEKRDRKQNNEKAKQQRRAIMAAVDKEKARLAIENPLMSEEDRNKKAQQAMYQKGKAMGLKTDEVDSLMKDKLYGKNWQDNDNLLAMAGKLAMNKISKTGNEQVSENKKFSKDERRAALKNLKTEDERNKFIAAFEEGKLQMKTGLKERILGRGEIIRKSGITQALESKKAREVLQKAGALDDDKIKTQYGLTDQQAIEEKKDQLIEAKRKEMTRFGGVKAVAEVAKNIAKEPIRKPIEAVKDYLEHGRIANEMADKGEVSRFKRGFGFLRRFTEENQKVKEELAARKKARKENPQYDMQRLREDAAREQMIAEGKINRTEMFGKEIRGPFGIADVKGKEGRKILQEKKDTMRNDLVKGENDKTRIKKNAAILSDKSKEGSAEYRYAKMEQDKLLGANFGKEGIPQNMNKPKYDSKGDIKGYEEDKGVKSYGQELQEERGKITEAINFNENKISTYKKQEKSLKAFDEIVEDVDKYSKKSGYIKEKDRQKIINKIDQLAQNGQIDAESKREIISDLTRNNYNHLQTNINIAKQLNIANTTESWQNAGMISESEKQEINKSVGSVLGNKASELTNEKSELQNKLKINNDNMKEYREFIKK